MQVKTKKIVSCSDWSIPKETVLEVIRIWKEKELVTVYYPSYGELSLVRGEWEEIKL